MKIAKMIVLAATLGGALQANAMCPVLFAAMLAKTKAENARIYSRQINGTGTPATPASSPAPDIRPAAKTGA